MRSLLLLFLLAPLSLLAACAPSAAGASSSNPFSIADTGIRVGGEAPFYVEATWPFASFDIKAKDLSGGLWVPTGVDSEGAVITTSFSFKDLTVPTGWALDLLQVKANRRTVQGRRDFDPNTSEETVTVLFRITPKPDAVAGPYSFRGNLDYRRGKAQPFRIDFTLVR